MGWYSPLTLPRLWARSLLVHRLWVRTSPYVGHMCALRLRACRNRYDMRSGEMLLCLGVQIYACTLM